MKHTWCFKPLHSSHYSTEEHQLLMCSGLPILLHLCPTLCSSPQGAALALVASQNLNCLWALVPAVSSASDT